MCQEQYCKPTQHLQEMATLTSHELTERLLVDHCDLTRRGGAELATVHPLRPKGDLRHPLSDTDQLWFLVEDALVRQRACLDVIGHVGIVSIDEDVRPTHVRLLGYGIVADSNHQRLIYVVAMLENANSLQNGQVDL